MPKISVIVPVYKVEKYLARCVDSILAQTFKDYELILVDDGSPDNCPAMCDEYAKKYDFIKVIHKENGGLSDARNKGIEYALTTDSEWITFIDSDDWVHSQYLEILYNACIENGVQISSCGFIRIKNFSKEETGKIIKSTETDVDKTENLISRKYKYEQFNISTAWARLYKKELWKEIRFPVGRLHEDEFTTYKLLFACDKIAVIKQILYFYFQNENGIMGSTYSVKRIEDIIDSYYEKVVYFYNHKFKYMFLKYSELLFQNFKVIYFYNKNKDIRKCLLKKIYYLDWVIKRNSDYNHIKRCGSKKWLTGRAKYIENFKNDVKTVRSQKGKLYSIFYYIKHFYKVYFGK